MAQLLDCSVAQIEMLTVVVSTRPATQAEAVRNITAAGFFNSSLFFSQTLLIAQPKIDVLLTESKYKLRFLFIVFQFPFQLSLMVEIPRTGRAAVKSLPGVRQSKI